MRTIRLPPSAEAARRAAYFECADDVEAAQRLGMPAPSFGQWRRERGLPTKIPPGAKKHMTSQQVVILEYLKAHGWSRMYEITRELKVHSWNVYSMLQALESKELVDVCVLHRIKIWAATGTPPPPRAMRMMRGFPSPYHGAHVPDRIRELLAKEKWLPAQIIARRLGSIAAVKTVEERVRELYVRGELQRQILATPIRRMYIYALNGTPFLRGRSAEKVRRLIGETTGFWKHPEAVLAALRKKPWQTSTDLRASAHLQRQQIYPALNRLLDTKAIVRVQVPPSHEGRIRKPELIYALKGTPPPENATEFAGPHGLTRALVAQIVHVHPRISAAEVVSLLNASRPPSRRVRYETALGVLGDLNRLGIVRLERRGRNAGRYSADGEVEGFVIAQAEPLWAQLQANSRRLRQLGYRVELELHPPAAPPGGIA